MVGRHRAGDDDKGDCFRGLRLFELFQRREAAHLRHHYVHDHQLRLFLRGHFDSLGTVLRGDQFIPGAFQMSFIEHPNQRVVIHY